MEEEGTGAEEEFEEASVSFAAVEGEEGLREGGFGWRVGDCKRRDVSVAAAVVFLEGVGVAGIGAGFILRLMMAIKVV